MEQNKDKTKATNPINRDCKVLAYTMNKYMNFKKIDKSYNFLGKWKFIQHAQKELEYLSKIVMITGMS